MPLPGILRKFSSKSLRSKSRLSTVDPDLDSGKRKSIRASSLEIEEPPSLPTQNPQPTERNKPSLIDGSQKRVKSQTVSTPDSIDKDPSARQSSSNGTAVVAVLASSTNGTPGFSTDLMDAWNVSHKGQPKPTGVTKILNTIEDGVDSTMSAQTVLNMVMTPMKALDATPEVANSIEKGVHGFLEAMPALMKALDEVARIHPFISVAVLAFKAVYTLEATRRDNDKKIISLYVEMKDMIAVLVQLKDVKDVEVTGPDNKTMKGRLQELATATAEDIKKCANTCDAYSKKKLIVKIFAGPIWEGKLLEFVGLFTKRRQEYEFSLSIHTAVGVDEANIKLIDVDERTREIDVKMELMLQMFQKFVTPEQQKVAAYIQSKGGSDTFENEAAFKELVAYEVKVSVPRDEDSRHGQSTRSKYDPSNIRREIEQDPDEAIAKNAELFDRKFEIQRRQIEADVARAVRREGDRIISVITGGPHDRIIDPDIYKIWKEMGWRGNVKARHFVLALRDYYHEKATSESSNDIPYPDRWALDYIHLNKAQPILEAFDDDASGFITVQEVNRLTQLRPRDWSLTHWIAYWAIGSQMTITDYCDKIHKIFAAMFHLLKDLKPMNRGVVDSYLAEAWSLVMVSTQSVEKDSGTELLRARFEPWVTAEEERLKQNLEDIRYDIDSYDTVRLVTGPGRIEMFLYPLLYLMLKRHLEIISLGRTHLLGKEELWDAKDTLYYLKDAAFFRLEHMRNIYKQQRTDKTAQLKVFAHGMFAHMDEVDIYFSGDLIRDLPDPEAVDEKILPGDSLDPEVILNHPVHIEQTIKHSAYDPIVTQTQEEWTGIDAILGSWYGILFLGIRPYIPKTSFTLERGDGVRDFRASGEQYRGGDSNHFQLEGHAGLEIDGFVDVNFKVTYPTQYAPFVFDGKLDVTEESIRGKWSYLDGTSGDFVFKRSSEAIRFLPAPGDVLESPARTRWRFALNSVRDQVKRNLWSKSFFLDRFRDRRRYIELATRAYHYGKALNANQGVELRTLYANLDHADTQFYTSLIGHNLATTSIHTGIECDNCSSTLGNIRSICMDCHCNKTTVDFCEDPACADTTISFDKNEGPEKPHLPTHDVFRVYSILHGRYFGMTERKAKEVLNTARKLLGEEEVDRESEPEAAEKPKPTCSHCKETVSLSPPCWACVKCKEMFICDDCDRKGLAFDEKHDRTHALVRCKPAGDNMSTEDRLIAMEARLSKMEQVLYSVLRKLDREDRIQVDKILEKEPGSV